ncbi:MAG: peptidoglycan-binding protein [Candidatus Omnitrophica bacterium]|jgi:peptidoglycan hydrolase-like protein with peptidoglycan-binding domain|nr:peptidoglycan-binding protein [Candidatus Omnitrophota bacterium]
MRGKVSVYVLAGFVVFLLCVFVFYRINGLSAQRKALIEEEQVIGAVDKYNIFVENIQFLLRGANLDPGSENGILDAQTRKAVKRFQSKHGLCPNGIVDLGTWRALEIEQEKLRSQIITDTAAAASGTLPENEKKEELAVTTEAETKTDKPVVYGNRNKQIQIALRKAGFYEGNIDGKIGPQSKAAIRLFQNSKGLKVDGIAGDKTMAELEKYLN